MVEEIGCCLFAKNRIDEEWDMNENKKELIMNERKIVFGWRV